MLTMVLEEFEYTKRVIKIRKSKDRQYNVQKKKNKRTNNHLLNTAKKTQDRATRTSLNRDELKCSARVNSSCSTSGTRRVIALLLGFTNILVPNSTSLHVWCKQDKCLRYYRNHNRMLSFVFTTQHEYLYYYFF
jgi:hypothetical protein